MASSSPVVTPGRTAAVTAAIAPAITSPEARISSTSCAVLIWIIRPLHFASNGSRASTPRRVHCRALSAVGRGRCPGVVGAQGRQGPSGDLVDLADRVDRRQQARPLVEPRQRRGLFPVDLEPVPDGLGLVVVALHQLAVDQHAAAGEPTDQLVLVDDELEHRSRA